MTFTLRLLFSTTPNSDDHVHFWNIKIVKELKGHWRKNIPNSVVQGWRGYPVFHHKILSFFPEKYWGIFGKLFTLFYDCLSITAVYIVSHFMFLQTSCKNISDAFSNHGLVALLVSTSPILLPRTPRVKSIGARTIGLFLSLQFFLILWFITFSHSFFLLPLVLLVGLIIILSSQFAFQNMVFSCIFLSIYFLNPIPVLIIFVLFLISFLIPSLGLKNIIIAKYYHFKWYYKNIVSGSTSINVRNRITDILSLPKYLFTDRIKAIKLMFLHSSILITLYSIPSLFILSFLVFSNKNVNALLANNTYIYIYSLSLFSIIAFFCTHLKPIKFLGEPERYFQYSIGYISFFYVFYIASNSMSSKWVFYLLIIQIVFVLVNLLVSNVKLLSENLLFRPSKNLHELITFLKTLECKKIVTIPTKLSFMLGYNLFFDHNFYYRFIFCTGKEKAYDYLDDDHIKFEYIRPDFQHFAKKYGINIIVASKRILKKGKRYSIYYNFGSAPIFENAEYYVYCLDGEFPNV